MSIERWPVGSTGRSRIVKHSGLVWTVSNTRDASLDFAEQVRDTFELLDDSLRMAGSARTHILSLQVLLTDIAQRDAFDAQYRAWIGPDPRHWPQRACYQAPLAPGLLVELIVVAADASAELGATH